MASSSPVLSSFTRPGNSRFLADFTLPRQVITCSRALSIWRERIPCFLMSHRCCCDRRLSQMMAANGFRILILFSGRPGHDGMFYGMFFQFLLNVEMICIFIIFIKAGISIRGKPEEAAALSCDYRAVNPKFRSTGPGDKDWAF